LLKERRKNMDSDPVVAARKALGPLWDESLLKGRCWGLKSITNNPYNGSNITMVLGEELVSVSQGKDGALRIHEFSRAKNTSFGNQVREILRREGLSFEK